MDLITSTPELAAKGLVRKGNTLVRIKAKLEINSDTKQTGRAQVPVRPSKRNPRSTPGVSISKIITPHSTVGVELTFDSEFASGEMDIPDCERDDDGFEANFADTVADVNAASEDDIIALLDDSEDEEYDFSFNELPNFELPPEEESDTDDHFDNETIDEQKDIDEEIDYAAKTEQSAIEDDLFNEDFSDRPGVIIRKGTRTPPRRGINRKVIRSRDPWGNIVRETSEIELRRLRRNTKSWDALDHEPKIAEIEQSLRSIFDLWHFDLPSDVEALLLTEEEQCIWAEERYPVSEVELLELRYHNWHPSIAASIERREELRYGYWSYDDYRDDRSEEELIADMSSDQLEALARLEAGVTREGYDRAWTDPTIDREEQLMLREEREEHEWHYGPREGDLRRLDVYRANLKGRRERSSGFYQKELYERLTAKAIAEFADIDPLELILGEIVNERGGKRAWYHGLNVAHVSDITDDEKDRRARIRRGNKPVRSIWVNKDLKIRAPETDIRRARMQALEERLVA